MLARLDPSDYQAAVNQAQADSTTWPWRSSTAPRNWLDRKLISQAEYDQRLALKKVHKSDLTRATNNLDYTQLFAPFDGVVARRLSENFESVAAGQVVLILQTKGR